MDPTQVVVATPIVAGLVEAAKRSGLPTDYAGPAAIVFGMAVASLVVDDPTSREAAVTGIVSGLSAAGLYSQAKYYADRFEAEAEDVTP